MAEGIKVSELVSAIKVANDDLLIIDKVQTNFEYITNSIKFEDFVSTITGLDLIFTGDVNFTGEVGFDGSLNIDGNINIDSGGNIDSPIVITELVKDFHYLSSSYTGAVVVLKVKVVDKDNTHRYFNDGSSRGFEIGGSMAPFFYFTPGVTYQFDLSDSSCRDHSLAFYYDSEKTRPFATRSTITTNDDEGVIFGGTPGQSGAFVRIEVKDNTPTILHYQSEEAMMEGNSFQCNANNLRGNKLGGLDDVSSAPASSGEVLTWNGVQWAPTDANDLSIDINTDNIPEGTENLYYTDERTRRALDVVVSSTEVPGGNLEYNQATGILTYFPTLPEIADGTVTSVAIESPNNTIKITDGVINDYGVIKIDQEEIINVKGTYRSANIEVDNYGRIIGVENGTDEIEKLDDIGDVDAPNPTTNQVLTWNGTGWEARDLVVEGALEYNGEVDLTVPYTESPENDALPNTPASWRRGDLYINISGQGTVDSSWTGISGREIVGLERIIWSGTEWDLFDMPPETELDLQQVTDLGAETSNTITVGGIISSGLRYPTSDGTANQVITTDGSGNLFFGLAGGPNGLKYMGQIDVTKDYELSPDNDNVSNNPDTWEAGDLFINISDEGEVDDSWIGIGGEFVIGFERVVWNGREWELVKSDATGTQDLQEVTDLGATTTNSIEVGGITAAGLRYPVADGAPNQVIQTDGEGNLVFGNKTEVLRYRGICDLSVSYRNVANGDVPDDRADFIRGDSYINQGESGLDSGEDWINDGIDGDYIIKGQEIVAWTGEVDAYGGGGWRIIGYVDSITGVVDLIAGNGVENISADPQRPIIQADKSWFDDPEKHYVNVQSDWIEEDPLSDAYILNKPNFDLQDLEDLQDLVRQGGKILQEDEDKIFGDGSAIWEDGTMRPIDHILFDRAFGVVLSINRQTGDILTTEKWIKDNGFATRAEGELALTALQPGDVADRVNVSELNNDAGYITQDQYNELLQLIANLQSQINNINNGTTSG